MGRVRKILRAPTLKNYFIVDACFLANKYINPNRAPNVHERNRIRYCREWWKEIEKQLKKGNARVYIPDICIAETFKVFAKKYYEDKWIHSPIELNNLRNRLRKDISIPYSTLRKHTRIIKYHDLPTCRDIIIAVDRFYELYMKLKKSVSLPDLILLATAKYLLDFYDIPRDCLHIVTLDQNLWSGSKKIQELPNAYNPTIINDRSDRIFK